MGNKRKLEAPEEPRHAILMRKVAIGVLAVGLSVAAIVFVIAPSEVEDDDAEVYVTSVSNSKKYQLDLERIGGKAAVVAAEFNEWFDSLWHGRRLAGTVAVLSVVASLLCILVAKLPPFDD